MSSGPLKDLKVVELAGLVAGPYCGKLFADFGADVVKVEPPTGDPARRRPPFLDDVPGEDRSGTYLYLNTNKRGVALDLDTEEDRERFRRLVAQADLLIEDRAPGELARLGLDYASLARINPGLVMTSVTPFGQFGPQSGDKAYYLNSFHSSGQGYLLPMNSPDTSREPLRGAGNLGEYDAGITAAIATLAALYAKRRRGIGQHVDVSKQHAMLHLERSQLRRFVDDGVKPDRTGMGRLLETLVKGKDGNYVVIILSSQLQWSGLFEAMGRPQWGAEPPFDTQTGRSDNYPELRAKLQEWADGYTAEEIFHMIQAKRSASAVINSAEMFMRSPQLAHRKFLIDIEHPVAGLLSYPGRPYQFSNHRETPNQPAPTLGQHNTEVFGVPAQHDAATVSEVAQAGAI